MEKIHNLVDKVERSYLSNYQKLPVDLQAHFAERYYKVKGKMVNKEAIEQVLHKKRKFLDDYIDKSDNEKGEYKHRLDRIRSYQKEDPRQLARLKRRERYYQGNSAAYVNAMLIWNFYKIYHLTRDREFFNKYHEKIRLLLEQEEANLHEHFMINSILVINNVFVMKHIGLEDQSGQIYSILENIRIDENFNSLDYLYSLTHIIIALSDFYQRFLDREEVAKNSFILKYFMDNMDNILEDANIDIICEIGLCFELCGRKEIKIRQLITDYLVQRYNPKYSLFTEGSSISLADMEHSNILAVMYYNLKQEFYLLF